MKKQRKCMRTELMMAISILLLFIISVSCIGCELKALTNTNSSDKTPIKPATASTSTTTTAVPQTTVPETTVPVTEPPKPPQFLNPLSGCEATEEISKTRPVSVCIGNTASSLPQFGISDAEILVEAPVEGGITRLMIISCNYANANIIGSVRSTRSYLADIANQFDAIQAYVGTTDSGKSTAFKSYDTMDYIIQNMSDVYFSDALRSSPHHIMTNGDRLLNGISSLGFRKSVSDKALPFEFPEYFSKATLSENDSLYVRIPFSSAQTAEFKYNTSTENYDRYQFSSLHSDSDNGKGLSFKNLILLFCDVTTYDKASGSEISIDTLNGGTGYYVSEGKYMDIIWYRDKNSDLKFADKNGTPLTINRGKTYIGLIRISTKTSVVLNSN